MDVLTQVLLGGVAAHAVLGRPRAGGGLGRLAFAAGALGGAVPDLDVLLRPLADPALPFELHRHFTHALVFAPIGGLLATLPVLLMRTPRRRFGAVWLAAAIGCLTHGPLDNLTSYGTHLWWPFIADRTAWDAMSIIDPLVTGVLLLGAVIALWRDDPRSARLAMILTLAYVAFGFVQHARALDAQRTLAASRGHAAEAGRTLPTPGNILLFRSIYRADGRMWADEIHVAPLGPVRRGAASSLPVFTASDLPPTATTRLREAFDGLRRFAGGHLGRGEDPEAPDRLVVADMRLSMETGGFQPLWGIVVGPDGRPAAWSRTRLSDGSIGDALARLLDQVVHPSEHFRPLPNVDGPTQLR